MNVIDAIAIPLEIGDSWLVTCDWYGDACSQRRRAERDQLIEGGVHISICSHYTADLALNLTDVEMRHHEEQAYGKGDDDRDDAEPQEHELAFVLTGRRRGDAEDQ